MSIAFVAAKHFARRLYKKLITLRTGACTGGQVGVKVGGSGREGGFPSTAAVAAAAVTADVSLVSGNGPNGLRSN